MTEEEVEGVVGPPTHVDSFGGWSHRTARIELTGYTSSSMPMDASRGTRKTVSD